MKLGGGQLGVRLDDHLACLIINDVRKRVSTFEIIDRNLDLLLFQTAKVAKCELCDLFAAPRNIFLLVLDVLFGLHADEVCVALGLYLDEKVVLRNDRCIDRVEQFQDLGIRILGILNNLFEDVVRNRFHIDLRREPQAEGT